MARNLREVLADFSPEDRKDIDVQAAAIIREEYARREQRTKQAQTKASGPVRSNTLTQVPAHG